MTDSQTGAPSDSRTRTPSDSRTREMIDFLARDAGTVVHERRARALRWSSYSQFWLAGAVVVLALAYALLPTREDLAVRLGRVDTPVLYLLWSAATLFPAIRVYALAFPDGRLPAPFRGFAKFALAPLTLLAIWTFTRFRFDDISYQLYRESSVLNGGCGMVIGVAGLIHAGFLFGWIRRGATTSPVQAGAWAAVSTASFASFIVQFACANENSIHVLLWHFLPLMVLTAMGALSAKRLFRW